MRQGSYGRMGDVMEILRSVFFDTQVITRASDGRIPERVWKQLLAEVSREYQYKVSFTTFLELLNALAGGDEKNFLRNRNRLLVLTEVPGSAFLPLPGQFIRNTVLGLPLQRPEFSPATLQFDWMPIIKAARSKQELSMGVPFGGFERGIDLTLVRQQLQNGQRLWVKELEAAKVGGKEMPPRELYSEFVLHFNVNAPSTPERIAKLNAALDAAYCHLQDIHHQATKSTYRFDRNPQDWIDNQQLMYLGDSNCTFVTADERLVAKLSKSTQRGQVSIFSEFLANP